MNRKTARQLDVVVAGLAVVDILGRPVDIGRLPKRGGLQVIDSVTMTTGGNVPNYGVDLAKLGMRVGAITRVGDDEFGRFVVRRLGEHGIDTGGVIVDRRKQTSSTFVAIAPDGERTFLHTRGCMTDFRARDVLAHLSMLRRCSILAFGYLGLLPECEPELPFLFARVRKATRARILLDTGGNPHRNPRLLKKLLPHVDIFLPSHDEAATLTGTSSPEKIVRACRAAGATGVVGVKLGARGCYVDHAGTAAYIPARRVRTVVDATGAGDAYVAGFIAATIRGADPFQAARFGNAVAASCVTAIGASTAIRRFEHYPAPIRTSSSPGRRNR
jgi:sugar/nucleoside kinase (ribokinase family)